LRERHFRGLSRQTSRYSGSAAIFGAVIIGAATALAVGLAANGLSALELRRLEDLLAVEATPFTHMNGVVSSSHA